MPNISGALETYRYLLRYRYSFSISVNKKRYDISLTFKKSDFFHLVGLQYLSDIDIPKSYTQLFSKIDNGKICDNALAKSIYYCKNQKTAFLFLRRRTNDEAYCICSFFVNPQNEYFGARAYWLYKSRILLENGQETVLYNRFGEDECL